MLIFLTHIYTVCPYLQAQKVSVEISSARLLPIHFTGRCTERLIMKLKQMVFCFWRVSAALHDVAGWSYIIAKKKTLQEDVLLTVHCQCRFCSKCIQRPGRLRHIWHLTANVVTLLKGDCQKWVSEMKKLVTVWRKLTPLEPKSGKWRNVFTIVSLWKRQKLICVGRSVC